MRHGPPGRGADEKPKNVKSSMLELLRYLKPWYKSIVISLIFSLVGTLLTIIAPDKLADLTNNISDGLQTGIDMDLIIKSILIILAIYISANLVTCAASYIMITVMQKLAWSMRTSISQKINKLPLKFFDKVTVGDVLSRITNDVDTISSALNSSITTLVQAVVQFVGVTIIMFATSGRLALTAIGSSILGFVLMFFIVSRSRKYFRQQQQNLGDMNGHVEEMYSGHNIVRAYGATAQSKKEFDRINDNLYNSAWKSQFFSGMLMPLMGFVGNLGYVAVCIVGATLTMSGAIRFGTVIAFISYVKLFTNPLSQISQAVSSLMSAGAAGERVFGFLAEEEMPDDSGCTAHIDHVRGKVEFENVRFGYDEDKPIIHDFSADIEPGQKVAIVGYTGAGKTTMVNLLMRFYELWSGQIKIDGVLVSQMRRSDVHAMFGMVLQDTWLFSGTVADNVAYGRPDATREEIIAACDEAYCDHFIRTLPQGYDTVVSEDSASISGGQKQLLTIARALLADRRLLILDEATSNVDTRTEILIQKAMDKLMRGRTCFVIAHRLSTIVDSDLILVLRDGQIVETGRHEELLARRGFYYDLYTSQYAI